MRSTAAFFACALLLLSMGTLAQSDEASRSTAVTVTGGSGRDVVVVGDQPRDESIPKVFDRVCIQSEQWHTVHANDIQNAVRLLRDQGPAMTDYVADIAMNAAQGRHDWVFWSIACGTLANSSPRGEAVLRSLMSNRSVAPWVRVAARQSLDRR